MFLKRVYDHSSGSPVLTGVKVLHAGDRQNFSQSFLDQGIEAGFVTMSRGEVIIHSTPELRYKIIRKPGYYCCFDDKPMSDGAAAREYIEKNFSGQTSPDPSNPAGYRQDNFYACVKVK